MKKITITLLCLAGITVVFSKAVKPKIKYGAITIEDFAPKAYEVDSSANAVYLYDGGKSYFEGNNNGFFSIIFEHHARMRILNKNGFDIATVEFKIYTPQITSEQEKLSELDATTYNLADGKVEVTRIDKGSIFKDKSGKWTTFKFTFPNIKEGSILEYKYKITKPSHYDISTWYFQGSYPRLWSDYNVVIPSFFDFVVSQQGFNKYVIDTGKISSDNYVISDAGLSTFQSSTTTSVRASTIDRYWAIQNVPALKIEPYISSLDNYISKVEFQLNAYKEPLTPKRVLENWPSACKTLMKDETFGADLGSGNHWLDDELKKINTKDTLQKVKEIFYYIKNNFSCTKHYALALSQSLKQTWKTHKGNVADINMLLVAAYKNQGFTAYPVLISTRDVTRASETYPLIDRYNYLLAKVYIGDQYYILDATNPHLGFAHLTEECYNGSGRTIDEDFPILVSLSPDSLRENSMTFTSLVNSDKGVEGSINSKLGYFQSLNVREKVAKSTQDEFFQKIKKGYNYDVTLSNMAIDSLKNDDVPVEVKYDFSFDFGKEDIVYFNPMLSEARKENPFKAAKRFYPVEMPYCPKEVYIFNMEIPKGYEIEELPKSTRVKLNETDGMFEYIVQKSDNGIQLRCIIQLNKATFEPDDYQTLRDFYSYIVKKEAEPIVFKKKKG